MRRGFVVAATFLVGVGALALAGCASSMAPKQTRHADAGIASAVGASLELLVGKGRR